MLLKCLLIFCILVGCYQKGQSQTYSYDELQAAYLYNFAKYIKWPRDTTVFVIGTYGKEAKIVDVLKSTLREKKVGGKDFYFKNVTSPEEAIGCHIVYFSRDENKNLTKVKPFLLSRSILLVTEDDMIKRGAMISFILTDSYLRFRIKKEALKEVGLVPSEGLLKLALPE